MAKIKKVFGFPAYNNAKNNKLGKKYFNKGTLSAHLKKYFNGIDELKIGDYVFTCNGANKKILSIDPEYTSDLILYDFTIKFTDGSFCSLKHCCAKAKSSAEVEKDKLESLLYWKSKGYCNDEVSEGIINTLKSGGHVVDENGVFI